MSKINWGIMGLDNIADEFASSLDKLGGIYAVAADSSSDVENFAHKHNVIVTYNDYEKMLNDKNIDAIYISTLGIQHFDNIIACLNHNKHVFCEKAILSKKEQIVKVSDLAKTKNLFLGEAMTIFYMPIYQKIQQIIASGEIGKLKTIKVDFGSLKSDGINSYLFSKEMGGGAMLDIGTYALTFLYTFFSAPPISVKSVMSNSPTGVDEMWSIILKNEQEIGAINLTFLAKLPKRAIIAGDKAYIQIYNYPRADTAEIIYPDGTTVKIKEGDTSEAVIYEILGVEKAIQSGHFEQGKLDTSIAVVSLMDQLMRDSNY